MGLQCYPDKTSPHQQLISLFFFFQRVSVMVLVWLRVCAVQVASVFAFPTTEGSSAMNVHPGTMDTQTVLVSGLHPSSPPV